MKKGQLVTWKSQSQGVTKQKTGTVIGFIEKGQNGHVLIPPGTKNSRIKFQSVNEVGRRVLVEVERGGKSVLSDFYAPYESQLKPVK